MGAGFTVTDKRYIERGKQKEADTYKRDKIRSYLVGRMQRTSNLPFLTLLHCAVVQSKMD